MVTRRKYEKECIFINTDYFNCIKFSIISICKLSILQIVYSKLAQWFSRMFFVFICLFFCYLKPDSIVIKPLYQPPWNREFVYN